MVSAGSYIVSVVLLAALVGSLAFSAVRMRRRLLPAWDGAPAYLVDAVLGVALLIWIAEILGVLQIFYAWTLVAASVLVLALAALLPRVAPRGRATATRPAGGAMTVVAVGAVALVFAHWGLTTADVLSRGIFNFDSLWYHMPFAVEMAESHSVTGLHYTETVFTNWFYPQNSELLHAVGILLTERDTLSLFLNFGWLAVAFLAAWCIGRPYGKAPLAVVAAAVILECHTLVVREPGAAKNDLMAAALLLAAIAVLVNAHLTRAAAKRPASLAPLAIAGLAAGMAVGTKSTALAMAFALTVAVVVLAPAGRRWAAAGWWFAAGLAGGGYWYLRNLVIGGNPIPQVESLGPISLPHPETLQSGRPDFNVIHYATDTAVWADYFAPGLDNAFGVLWPLVIGGAVAGGLLALLQRQDRLLRWLGGAVLFGLVAYLFTPLSAAGAEGAPEAFRINLRFAIPALLAGIALLPVALPSAGDRTRGRIPWSWALMGLLLIVLVATNRADAVVRDPDRLFAWGLALLLVLIPTALIYARQRGASRTAVASGFAILALAIAAIGYPLQRDYLEDRFANADPATSIPGMSLDSAYRWARGVEDARIGLAGTTTGFLQYGFYGTDLSNQVRYLGEKGPHGAFNAIPSCAEFRAAVNAADLDYLVTAPFLNFIEPGQPIGSPEAGWLRGEPAVTPVDSSGPVTVWRLDGRLDPAGCPAPAASEEAGPILSSRDAIAILGDSYSAGEGADEYLAGHDTAANPCHRSRHTYLVAALEVDPARILACSGAEANDVHFSQQGRTVAPQVEQLRNVRDRIGVDAVVLTLGGNDAGFADVVISCILRDCAKRIYTGSLRLFGQPAETFVAERLDALPGALRAGYLGLNYVVNGPEARLRGGPVPILVLAYPLSTPSQPGPCGAMWNRIKGREYDFLDRLGRRLNDTIEGTVAATREEDGVPIFFVRDTERAFLPDHTLCDARPYARTLESFDGAGRETKRAVLREVRLGLRELFHPNRDGYTALSRAVLEWSRSGEARDALGIVEGAPTAELPSPTAAADGEERVREAPFLAGSWLAARAG